MKVPVAKISVVARHSLPLDKDRRRSWVVDVTQTYPNRPELCHKRKMTLMDPFTMDAYDAYEKELSGRNVVPPGHTAHIRTGKPPATLDDYRETLRKSLELDMVPHDRCIVKITIGEPLEPDVDENYCSIHSLLWELLEHDVVDPITQKNHHAQIQVKRCIAGIQDAGPLPAGLRCVSKPIRLLLVLARNLQRHDDSTFHDVRSVVHDNLYALVRYLRCQGLRDRLVLHVVRPGTLAELEEHLKREARYDMAHFDLHGWADGSGDPALLFARPDTYENPPRDELVMNRKTLDYVPAEKVAKLLEASGIVAVALDACLSSYSQRGPLDNMCRVFAGHGVLAVTGMSFTVPALSAEAYYAAFYPALVLANLDFHGAALHARRMLRMKEVHPSFNKKKQQQSQSWPTATTFFAANKLDKVSSGDGVVEHLETTASKLSTAMTDFVAHLRFSLPLMAGLSAVLALFWSRNAGAKVFVAVALLTTMAARRRVHHLSRFEAFMKDPANLAMKHSVELMALEDRLKKQHRLFIQITRPYKEEELNKWPHALQDLWLTTGFADTIEVVSASRFKHQRSLWLHLQLLRHNMARHYASLKAWWRGPNLPLALHAQEQVRSPRAVLIIDQLDAMVKQGKDLYPEALNRMDQYIRQVTARNPSGILLIIVGRKTVGWCKSDRF